jgi:hypothetical protein
MPVRGFIESARCGDRKLADRILFAPLTARLGSVGIGTARIAHPDGFRANTIQDNLSL